MRASPKISINLCCYNSERYLRETLESIIGQTWQDWELVIVNDGSTDRTESIIREYQERGYPILYHYQSNRGLAFSRNQAIELSRGDFIAFIDHDDVWLKDKLEKQVCVIERETDDIALVYTKALYFTVYGEERELPSEYAGRDLPEGKILPDLLLMGNFITLSSALARRDACLSLGCFPTQYQYAEDYYLFSGLAAKYRTRCIQSICCRYRLHEANVTRVLKTKGYREMLEVFLAWSNDLGDEVTAGQKERRIRELNSLIGAMMIRHDGDFVGGIKHTFSHGSWRMLTSHIWRHKMLPGWQKLLSKPERHSSRG